MRSLNTTAKSSSCSLQLGKALITQQRHRAVKNNKLINLIFFLKYISHNRAAAKTLWPYFVCCKRMVSSLQLVLRFLEARGAWKEWRKSRLWVPRGLNARWTKSLAAPASDLYEVTQPREEAEVVTDSLPMWPLCCRIEAAPGSLCSPGAEWVNVHCAGQVALLAVKIHSCIWNTTDCEM